MELSDLRIFRAVVDAGGITRAAERLHRVQSNVTTRIRQLEEKLDTRLFNREGKRLVLTPAGHTLLAYSDKILALARQAEAAVSDEYPSGPFHLGAMESTAAVRLPGPMALFAERFDKVTIELRTGNPPLLSKALLAGEIEAALIAEPVAETNFDSVVAFEEEAVIVTSTEIPPLLDKSPLPNAMLVFEQGCPHRRLLELWYEKRGEIPQRTIEIGSYHAMFGCVLAGMGAALVPKSVISTFPQNDRLRINPLPANENRICTRFIWRKGARSSKVDAFVSILKESAAE